MVQRRGDVEIVALLTTLNAAYSRVAMHAVRETLLEAQAAALGLPLVKVPIPSPCPNTVYEAAMEVAISQARAGGITHMVFGDLFLEDIRKYREERLARTGVTPLFPLWGLDTKDLAREMVETGLGAYLTCVDPKKLDRTFAGRVFDKGLLADLPAFYHPETHSISNAYQGPMFRKPIAVEVGEVVEREGFIFADILPARPRRGLQTVSV
jgi:diphthamide synthase (EF-2-diphthine--ammonia ligase)